MTKQQVIEALENFNAWRRGEHDEMPDTNFMGKVLDKAVTYLKHL